MQDGCDWEQVMPLEVRGTSAEGTLEKFFSSEAQAVRNLEAPFD